MLLLNNLYGQSMKALSKYKIFWSIAIILLILSDLISKNLVSTYLRDFVGMTKDFTSFFGFVHSWNHGISFGLFSEYHYYSNIAFSILNSLIISYLIYIYYMSDKGILIGAYAIIISGATGNLIDRFINGAVFDFIYLHYQNYHFPVFNLADCYISLGIMMLIYDMFKSDKSGPTIN